MLARALIVLALLFAPLLSPAGGRLAMPAAAMPICLAGGGIRLVPDPMAPALPAPVHCDACLATPPTLPVPPTTLRRTGPLRQGWPVGAAQRPAPSVPPRPQARAPPIG